MTPELTALTLAALLQVVQFVLMAVPLNAQLGVAQTTGPRDTPLQPTGIPARLKRAMDNHFEGLILFTIAVVVVTLGARSTALTQTCAWTYLIARAIYVPAYASGIPFLRSAIWSVGFLATVIMLIAALI